MQPSPGPDLPHTATRPWHWLVTAVALAAVVGGAGLVQPDDASAGPAASAVRAAGGGPDPAAARYPMDCGPWRPQVVDQAAVDFDGDGRAETVAVVRCGSGAGTAPHGVFVLAHPKAGHRQPRVAEVLLDPAEGLTVQRFRVREGTVRARLLGYSSPRVPRCCPDRQRDVEWSWRDGRFHLMAGPLPGSV